MYLEYFYNSHLNELGYITYLSLEVVKATQEQVSKPQKLETLSDDIGSASSISRSTVLLPHLANIQGGQLKRPFHFHSQHIWNPVYGSIHLKTEIISQET